MITSEVHPDPLDPSIDPVEAHRAQMNLMLVSKTLKEAGDIPKKYYDQLAIIESDERATKWMTAERSPVKNLRYLVIGLEVSRQSITNVLELCARRATQLRSVILENVGPADLRPLQDLSSAFISEFTSSKRTC